MDIGAYAKINDLSTILDSTGINIPRLRGLRLMAMEERITEEEIKEMTASAEADAVEDLVRACPPWSVNSDCHSYCRRSFKRLSLAIHLQKFQIHALIPIFHCVR